jgi:hypothetical protein
MSDLPEFFDSFVFGDTIFDDKSLLDSFDVESYNSEDWFFTKRQKSPTKIPQKVPRKVKFQKPKKIVKDILNHKISKKGIKYLVLWETGDKSWELYDNIKNLQLLQVYLEKNKIEKLKVEKNVEIIVID